MCSSDFKCKLMSYYIVTVQRCCYIPSPPCPPHCASPHGSMTVLVFAVKLCVARPLAGVSAPAVHSSDSRWGGQWPSTSSPEWPLTPSLCLVALKRRRWGFLPSQAVGCNWCGRNVRANLLLYDGPSVSPSSTPLCDLPYQPLRTAT